MIKLLNAQSHLTSFKYNPHRNTKTPPFMGQQTQAKPLWYIYNKVK